MTGVLEENRDAIVELCRRYGVLRLEVFGSSLRQEFDSATSDFDFLVEFEAMEPYARVDAYFGLLEELQSTLGREVDLVMVDAVTNPYIAREIERTKQPLYAA